MLGLLRRGLAALWGGTAVARRETPYFPEATRLFFLSPHNLSAELSGQLTHPYREHVWVYACVNAIAQSISSVPLLIKTGTRKDSRVVEDSRWERLIEAPNPYMSGSQLIEATLIYLGLTGEAFYLLDRASDRELPREIWVCHPERMQEVVDHKTSLITGWVYSRGADKVPLQPHEVVFFRYINPYNDYRGLSPLQAARAGIEQDYWASHYNAAFFRNSAQPGGILETSTNLTDEEFKRLLAQFEDRHRGSAKSHRIALLEGGVTYKQTGLSQRDMDFLEQRRWNREEIMAAFKVPKGELGLYEDVNYATAKTQRKLYWENTLIPKMVMIEYVLWGQLFRRIDGGRLWAEFDYASITALHEDRRELIDSAHKLWSMGVPINTINDYLGLGLPAVAGGDVGYLPFNLAPVASGKSTPEKTVVELRPAAGPLMLKGFDAEAYWRAYLDLHTPLETRVQRKISRYIYGQRKRQLRKLAKQLGKAVTRDYLVVEGLLLDLPSENSILQKMIWPLYQEIGQTAGQEMMVELGADPETFTLVDSPAMAALEDKLIKVTRINDTIREQLRDTLLEGMGQMETTAELMERVKQIYNLTQSRALTIARTETGQAAGIARDAVMGQMGVAYHRWVTAGDEHVRTSHQELNGMVLERGQLFPNGCRFPCDPAGPAGETLNCRCTSAPLVD